MECESCGNEIDKEEQFLGQYEKVCFECWHNGNFKSDNKRVMMNFSAYKNFLERIDKNAK